MDDTNKEEEYELCLACVGSGVIYDSEEDMDKPCKYCETTGEASSAENEIFLSKEINQN
jgi:hypothetical protein